MLCILKEYKNVSLTKISGEDLHIFAWPGGLPLLRSDIYKYGKNNERDAINN